MSKDNLDDLLPVAQEKDAALEVRLAEQHIELAAKLLATKLVFHVPADGTLYEAVERVADGGTIKLAAGCFKLDETLFIQRSLKIQGTGTQASTIEMQGLRNVSLIEASGSINISFSDLHFLTTSDQCSTIILRVSSFSISKCHFEMPHTKTTRESVGNRWRLLDIYSGRGTVKDSKFQGHSVSIKAAGRNSDVDLTYNTCRSEDNGISVFDQAKARISGNHISRYRCEGISVVNSKATVTDNVCEGNSNEAAGICAYNIGSSKVEVQLTGNTCRKNGDSGIILYGVQGTISENFCSENNIGIDITNNSAATVQKNNCCNNKWLGIVFCDNSSGTAISNVCEANGGEGIAVKNSDKVEIVENQCNKNHSNGIGFLDKAKGLAKNNICEKNRKNGIDITGDSQGVIEGNICRVNARCGIELTNNAKAEISSNTFSENLVGIWFREGSQGSITENVCEHNTWSGGIRLDTEHPVAVRNNRCNGNSNNGISFMGEGEGQSWATGNTCNGNDGVGIAIYDGLVEVADNQCFRNRVYGIQFDTRSEGSAHGNRCGENGKKDIHASKKSKTLLDGSNKTMLLLQNLGDITKGDIE